MADPAIHVERLGKQYRLGGSAVQESLRERIAAVASGSGRGESPLFWALRNLSVDVAAGEVLGVIGGNGAGKSTFLKILSRITMPTEGRAVIRGRVGSLLEVGTGFHPDLTGRENILLNGALLGMRRAETLRKFDEIVAFAEVERFVDTPVKHYSSGMYVRLAFAVAAHLEPEILIVDEVLAVGDAAFQKKCLGAMDRVARGGRTVLFVSHNMAAIQRLCTRCIVLESGALAFSGLPRDAVARYLGGGAHARYQRTVPTKEPHVVQAELVSADGAPLARADITAPVGVRMHVRLPGPAVGTRFGIGMLSGDGTPVFTTNLDDVGMDVPAGPCEFVATVTIPPNSLLAGTYHVVTCLWNDLDVVDLQEPAFSFAADTGTSVLYQRNIDRKGVVHVDCRWDLSVSPPLEAHAVR